MSQLDAVLAEIDRDLDQSLARLFQSVSYTHLTLPTNREV